MAFARFQKDLFAEIEGSFAALQDIWDQFGLSREESDIRGKEVIQHVKALLEDLSRDETAQRDQILRLIEDNKKRVKCLAKELQTDINISFDKPLLLLDADLESRRIELEEVREQRLEEKLELESRIEALAESQVVDQSVAHSILEDHDLTQHGIEKLRHTVDEYEKEYAERKHKIALMIQDILPLVEQVGYEAETDFESAALDDFDSLPLSQENAFELERFLAKLQTLQANLSSDIKLKWQEVCQRWSDLEVDIAQSHALIEKLGATPGSPLASTELPTNGDSMRLLKQESAALDTLEQDKLPLVLSKRFVKLQQLWKKCYTCALEQKAFCAANGCEGLTADEPWESVPAELRQDVRRYMCMFVCVCVLVYLNVFVSVYLCVHVLLRK